MVEITLVVLYVYRVSFQDTRTSLRLGIICHMEIIFR
jgi:hypothetical protein